MTMTGRVMADQIGDEFLPDDEAAVPWAHEFGALDAANLIPAGSTVPCYQGHLGFGVASTTRREVSKWKTTAG